MIIDPYAREFEIDVELDIKNMASKTLSHPNLHHKWHYRLMQHKKKIHELKAELEVFIRDESVKEKQLAKVSMAKLNTKINNTTTALDITRRIKDEEFIVDYLDGCMKILTNMAFNYKTLAEWNATESFGLR
jgi:hypothetical protein|tara:strand:+ start:16535 stop:16930 length:396 start_codon:yes stop_codon:yes gene_type:complete